MKTIFIFTLFLSSSIAWAGDLQLTLRIHTPECLQSQRIWVTAILKNNGTTSEEVPFWIIDEVEGGIRFIGENENKISLKEKGSVIVDDFGLNPPKKISPGDSIENSFNILSILTNKRIDEAPSYLVTKCYITPGNYTLYAVAHRGEEKFTSNNVTFTIKEPKGEQYEDFMNLRAAEENRQIRNYHKSLSLLQNFVSKRPHSPYALIAYDKIFFLSHSCQIPVNFFEYIQRLATDFPDDLHTEEILKENYNSLNKDQKRELYEILKSKFPNSKAFKECKRKYAPH